MTAVPPELRLESRYRLCLRAYPSSWRSEHEQDILACLMEASSADQQRPHLTDASNLVLNGLIRRGRDWLVKPSTRLMAQAFRSAASLGLLILAGLAALVAVGAAFHPSAVVASPALLCPALLAAGAFVAAWTLDLLRRDRAALVTCLLGDVFGVAVLVVSVHTAQLGGPRTVPLALVSMLAAETTACLFLSRNQERPATGRVRIAVIGTFALTLLAAELAHPGGVLGVTHTGGDSALLRAGAAFGLTISSLAIGLSLRDPRGLITVLVLVGPAAPTALIVSSHSHWPGGTAGVTGLLALTLAVLLVATRWSVRRRVEALTS